VPNEISSPASTTGAIDHFRIQQLKQAKPAAP